MILKYGLVKAILVAVIFGVILGVILGVTKTEMPIWRNAILAPFLVIIPIVLCVLSIYALILLIKALKKYIDKNS